MHEDIDQAFSSTSRGIRARNATILNSIHAEPLNVYKKVRTVSKPGHITTLSAFCREQKCLQPVPAFSHLPYFQFLRKPDSSLPSNSNYCQKPCFVKEYVSQEWSTLRMRADAYKTANILPQQVHCFISFHRDLVFTPPTHIKEPLGESKVTKRGV